MTALKRSISGTLGLFESVTLGQLEFVEPVVALITQLSHFEEEELKHLPERMNYVRELCAAPSLPSIEEFKALLSTTTLSWLPKPSKLPVLKKDWLGKRLENEVKAWMRWGVKIPQKLQDFYLEVLKTRGKERVALDEGYGLAYCLLPELIPTKGGYPRGWVKPESCYWENLQKGELLLPNGSIIRDCQLKAGVYLVDTRCKPNYQDGKQRWQEDFLMEAVITRLQEEGKLPIHKKAGKGSRFYLSRNDYEQIVAPLYREALELPEGATVRLETVPEWSALCQYKSGSTWPRRRDGETNTWVWFYEHLNSSEYSLAGGFSSSGGLARVDCGYSDYRWDYVSARLLAVWPLG